MAAVKFSTLANSDRHRDGDRLRVPAAPRRGGRARSGCCCALLITLSLLRYGYSVLRTSRTAGTTFRRPTSSRRIRSAQFTVVVHSVLFGTLLFLLATTPFVDGALRWPLLVVVAAVFPGVGGDHGDDAKRGCRAESGRASRASCGDLGGDYVKLLVVSLLLSAFTALTSGRAVVPRRLRGDGGRLGEPRAVPRDGRDVARASLRARSHGGRRRRRAARASASGRRSGRRRSIAPTPRCAAACRRRRIAPSKSSSRAKATASRSINGRSTACWRGTTRGTRRCSASGSRSGSGTRAARSMRSSSRNAAASSRRASCRRPRSRRSSPPTRASSAGTASPTSSPSSPQRSAPASS